MKTLVVAEGQKILRDALKVLLSEIDYLNVVGEAEDGSSAIRAVELHRPDLVLMELSMPRVSGVTALNEIKRRSPETKVVVLTVHDSDEHIFEAFHSGTDGYCLKDSSFEELNRAIQCVLSGKPYFSTAISDRILEGYLKGGRASKGENSKLQSLTQREKDILKLVGENYRNQEIAELLFISVKTVEKHRSNIMRKLNCHTSSALTAFSLRNGLAVKKSRWSAGMS